MYVINNGQMELQRLKELALLVGKQRPLLDLSCGKKIGRFFFMLELDTVEIWEAAPTILRSFTVGSIMRLSRMRMACVWDTRECCKCKYFSAELAARTDNIRAIFMLMGLVVNCASNVEFGYALALTYTRIFHGVLDLQDFFLRALVLKLYRQALRIARRGPCHGRADLMHMENNENCSGKQRIRFLINDKRGKGKLKGSWMRCLRIFSQQTRSSQILYIRKIHMLEN
ncbi:hypothetical protein RHMOL_Rhmol07G0315800 [Rhododendron molle]|uniref:Uncharacterized protein n=1 Tax=Rhododendron molle TaxID=49168 RepID=A0ACC0N6U7_RHOML|nr:hypothetical protein RHMOL_Rhmol07G0315800 [Rhododendron molle]